MVLVVDGKSMAVQFDGDVTLGAVLQYVSALPECRQRVIERVAIDGAEVQSWDESSSIPVAAGSEVRVSTRPLGRVLLETTLSCKEYLPRLMEGCVGAAAAIQQGREAQALQTIHQLVEGVQWYDEFLRQIEALHPPAGNDVRIRLDLLQGALGQLMSSLERQDLTLVADVLEYELAPELQAGLGFVEVLLAGLAADLGNGT